MVFWEKKALKRTFKAKKFTQFYKGIAILGLKHLKNSNLPQQIFVFILISQPTLKLSTFSPTQPFTIPLMFQAQIQAQLAVLPTFFFVGEMKPFVISALIV